MLVLCGTLWSAAISSQDSCAATQRPASATPPNHEGHESRSSRAGACEEGHEGRDEGQEEVSGPGRRWQLSATFAGHICFELQVTPPGVRKSARIRPQ